MRLGYYKSVLSILNTADASLGNETRRGGEHTANYQSLEVWMGNVLNVQYLHQVFWSMKLKVYTQQND